MRSFLGLVSFAALILTASEAGAQYSAYKSADGILVISERPGQYFSVDLPGNKIVPIGEKEAPHPYFMIDDHLVQVMPVPIREFKGNPSEHDEVVLRQQAQYEIEYWKPSKSGSQSIKLRSGRKALFWYFNSPQPAPDKSQAFCSLRENSYVLVLTWQPKGRESALAGREFLLRAAESFRASSTRIPPPKIR